MLVFRISIALILSGVVLAAGCSDPNLKYAKQLSTSLVSFDKQKDKTQPVVDNAQEKLQLAQEIRFNPESRRTREFRSDWAKASASVAKLRKSYDDVIERADFHFKFIEKKIGNMSTSDIRQKMWDKTQQKKSSFAEVAKRSYRAVASLENIAKRGNDIITALDVINALESVSSDTVELMGLIEEANDLRPALDDLVTAGNNILNSEL